MRGILADLPLFLPGVAVFLVVGLLVARLLGRSMGVRPQLALLLVVAVGAIVAATLTPTGSRLAGAPPSPMVCLVDRWGPAPLSDYLWFTSTSLNVALFVPLGLAVGLMPRSRRSTTLAAVVIGVPFAVEATQFLVTTLGRDCRTGDLFDNLLGLAIGMVLGLAARRSLPPV